MMNPWITKAVAESRIDDLRRAADADRLVARPRSYRRHFDLGDRLGAVLIRVGSRLIGPETRGLGVTSGASPCR